MPRPPTPSELTVLALLHEGPNHPYAMQRLVRERRIDDLVPVHRGTLYHAVERLDRQGLIESVETTRSGKRPEKTVYAITEAGADTLLDRLRALVSEPEREFPEFATALSFLGRLSPDDARAQLELRRATLEGQVAGLAAELAHLGPRLPRVWLIESEYWLARLHAELEWLRGVLADLHAGRFGWDPEPAPDPAGLHVVPEREAG